MGALRDRMVREMQLRRFAPSTQQAYVRAVWGLAAFYRRSPDELTSEEVKSYLLHLMNERGLNWGTVNVACPGIRFLFSQTLGRSEVSADPHHDPVRAPDGEEAGRDAESARPPRAWPPGVRPVGGGHGCCLLLRASRWKARDLARCRQLLGVPAPPPVPLDKTTPELLLHLTGTDLTLCPRCQRGTMRFVRRLARQYPLGLSPFPALGLIQDTS